jgi:hypothetical protein
MTGTLFITLLTIFSTVTSLITQGVKKILDEKKVAYASNVLVIIIACIVGIGGTAVFYILNSVEFDIANTTCMIIMGLATSLGAAVGYDKVIQTVKQCSFSK